MKGFVLLLSLAACIVFSMSQDDFYAEYARGAGLAKKKNGFGNLIIAGAGVAAGGVIGAFAHGQGLKKKHAKEKKDLIQYLQLQEEIYKQRDAQWQAEYSKLYKAYEQLEKETLERDYEEFKAPDTDNDDKISRTEFNTYVRKYLSSFPELSERDFPRFEEFDLDGDGIVSFEEWQQFLYQQKLKEANAGKAGQKSAYGDLLNALYEQSYQSDSFNTLQKKIGANAKGGARRA